MSSTEPTTSLRAILVDDEQPARELLREQLAAHPEIKIVGEADRVSSAAELVKELAPDLIFLDVQMPGQTGFALLPVLSEQASPPLVVFVTAYDTYAVRAFEVNALDYLTKPVNSRRLATTVERLLKAHLRAPLVGTSISPGEPSSANRLETKDLVLLRSKSGMRMIKTEEIYAVEAQRDYTNIIIAGDQTLFMRKKIAQWEKELPSPPFLKVSRRLILNTLLIDQVVSLERERSVLRLKGSQTSLVISRIEVRRIREVLVDRRG